MVGERPARNNNSRRRAHREEESVTGGQPRIDNAREQAGGGEGRKRVCVLSQEHS